MKSSRRAFLFYAVATALRLFLIRPDRQGRTTTQRKNSERHPQPSSLRERMKGCIRGGISTPILRENPLPTFPDEIIVANNEACSNERVTHLRWMFLTCNASWENVR